jgi:dihydrofolate reductase
MNRITVVNHLTLDGVMQAPGRAGEDERDGFTHGGWAQAGNDPVMGEVMAEGMGRGSGLLLGRRTYEDFAGFWPRQTDSPFRPVLNAMRKYVATRTLTDSTWENTTLLAGDAVATVATLKRESPTNLPILGSGDLIRSLLPHGLIDVWMLLIHPRLLGTGQRLFPATGVPVNLSLRQAVTTTTGVVIATYDA